MAPYRLTSICTRTGDDGTTALGSGRRVAKDSARIEACGAVDELNSCLSVAAACGLDRQVAAAVRLVQNDLFVLGSDLCLRERDKRKRGGPRIEKRHVARLEARLAQLRHSLGPLREFVLPGGAPGAAQLHVCRCVCRRAERRIVRLKRKERIGAHALEYLNRLGDLLFLLARYENLKQGVPEELWQREV